jgi:hypothetical protein
MNSAEKPIAAQRVRVIQIADGDRRRDFHVREGTRDEILAEQMLRDREHGLRKLRRWPDLQRLLDERAAERLRPLVIDAGANIGASAILFSALLPRAIIVAIEPEAGNFALLRKNVEGLDIRCIRGELAAERGQMPSVTIDSIYAEFCDELVFPFLVKIDIERGEPSVFSANTDWVVRTPVVIVQPHDGSLPKSGVASPFLNCMSALDRDFVYMDESIVSIDKGI